MKIILEEANRVRLTEETLTDGSKVYNVELLADYGDEMIEVNCTTHEKATFLFQWLSDHNNVTGIN